MRKLVYLVASTIDGFIADVSRADPSGTIFQLESDHAEPLIREYPELVPVHVRGAVVWRTPRVVTSTRSWKDVSPTPWA